MRRSARTIAAATALAMSALISMSGLVSAALIERGTFHDEFSEFVEDFCDVPGLDVQVDGVVDGTFHVMSRGRDGLVYFMDHVRATRVLTNVANGATVSDREITVSKDHKVVDNGDGTLTITVLATGNFTLYGADGKALARNPGQVRFQFLVDHAGTPADPRDDIELEFLGFVKESTGRSDDVCAAIADALT
jgi:hypothetical protein